MTTSNQEHSVAFLDSLYQQLSWWKKNVSHREPQSSRFLALVTLSDINKGTVASSPLYLTSSSHTQAALRSHLDPSVPDYANPASSALLAGRAL